MSVNWDWKAKKGVITWKNTLSDKKSFKVNLYQANCLGALIYEYKDNGQDMYKFIGFWNDIDHLKRCLGFTKLYGSGIKENIYADNIVKIKLNTFYKDSLKIADLFSKIGVKVELYYKEIK